MQTFRGIHPAGFDGMKADRGEGDQEDGGAGVYENGQWVYHFAGLPGFGHIYFFYYAWNAVSFGSTIQ